MNALQKSLDLIDIQSYEAGYAAGHVDGDLVGYEVGYRACALDGRIAKRNRMLIMLYFAKQKIAGVILLFLTLLTIPVLDGDATIALFTVPLSLLLIFSKQKIFAVEKDCDGCFGDCERCEGEE